MAKSWLDKQCAWKCLEARVAAVEAVAEAVEVALAMEEVVEEATGATATPTVVATVVATDVTVMIVVGTVVAMTVDMTDTAGARPALGVAAAQALDVARTFLHATATYRRDPCCLLPAAMLLHHPLLLQLQPLQLLHVPHASPLLQRLHASPFHLHLATRAVSFSLSLSCIVAAPRPSPYHPGRRY